MLKSLLTLWQFSRPHTIIGSVVSITTLWLLALRGQPLQPHLGLLLLSILTGIACNIFIVGLNQIIDKDLDKINKPNLPLAAGTLTMTAARRIIAVCAVLAIGLAFYTSSVLGVLVLVISVIGIAYSVPPIQLKKHHLPAAIAITLVRGVLVNLGFWAHFQVATDQIQVTDLNLAYFLHIPTPVLVLTGFVVAFSIAIAWFKDLPDATGDQQFQIKTLAVLYSTRFAFMAGLGMVLCAYVCALVWAYRAHEMGLFYAHLVAAALFLLNASFVKLDVPATISRFYLLFWVFFFAEYLFFAGWSLF
jgi:homogentisate phytyltransferase / homogentisate geranylgeranyltransferase